LSGQKSAKIQLSKAFLLTVGILVMRAGISHEIITYRVMVYHAEDVQMFA